jgi:hypothetical protein
MDVADDYVTEPEPERFSRSRVTNGSKLLPGIDGRSTWARRARDVLAEHLSDTPNASAAEASLIRRVAVITTELEMLEQKFARAEGAATIEDLDLYQRMASALRRLLEAVHAGLERRPRDVTTGADAHLFNLIDQEEPAA